MTSLVKRQTELGKMLDRLLTAHLSGTVEEATYLSKSQELKSEAKDVEEAIGSLNAEDSPVDVDLGLKLFDLSQNLVELWLGSNIAARREILDLLCLNRTLSDVSLDLVKRKPFDAIAKRPVLEKSRGDRIRTYDPLLPKMVGQQIGIASLLGI
jgi:flagellar biosynthesis/type III secretory pathway ATPase